MKVAMGLRELSLEEAVALENKGAAFVDLRPTREYLDVHIPRSLALFYEFGPGMAARARDCIPLDVPLILLESDNADLTNAAASLRGKGFTLIGSVADGVNRWSKAHGIPLSTETIEGMVPPEGTLLDVNDPGGQKPEGALRVSIEKLWSAAARLTKYDRLVIVAGFGVRAGLAVGMLERGGLRQILFWWSRPN